uniref:Uncharacterized protein n=2 Tax=Aegilops tauschii subsp. strangulata TaxID=200361 RepID=A0A453RZF3_AEGTS
FHLLLCANPPPPVPPSCGPPPRYPPSPRRPATPTDAPPCAPAFSPRAPRPPLSLRCPLRQAPPTPGGPAQRRRRRPATSFFRRPHSHRPHHVLPPPSNHWIQWDPDPPPLVSRSSISQPPHGSQPPALPTPPRRTAGVAPEASRPSSLSFPSSSSPLPHTLVPQEPSWPSDSSSPVAAALDPAAISQIRSSLQFAWVAR